MSIQDRLQREVEEMEALMNPTNAEAHQEEDKVDKTEIEAESNPEVVQPKATEEEREVIEDVPEKKKRNDWKKKYEENSRRMAGLKASGDTFKHESRLQIEQLKQQIEELQSREVVKPDVFDGVFTDEDRDVIGDEAVNIIKKASQKVSENGLDPLRKELLELKKEKAEEQVRQQQRDSERTYDTFLNSLDKLVPEWQSINADPEFISYLSDVDEHSGYTRQELLHRAEQNGDVSRVAGFMQSFYDTSNPGKKKLAEKVGPTNSTGASVVGEGVEAMPGSYIDKFYEDSIRGAFKGNEMVQQQIQSEIDKALTTKGGVDFDK